MKQSMNLPAHGLALLLGAGTFAFCISGCTTARIPATNLEVPLPDIPLPAILRGENDLRSRTRPKAFAIFHERIKREYAYGEQKGVDWDALFTRISVEVAASDTEKDRDAWYLALRHYVYAIPDGNVQIDPDEGLRAKAEGASAGLALTQLSDGRVIVCGLVPDGPAEAAGIEWGAEVAVWNEKPVAEALEKTSILWADAPVSTPYMRVQQQLAWLPRGGAGESCRVTFKNPGAGAEETVTLVREVDDYATLPLCRPLWKAVELFDSPIESTSLDGGYRYIRVAAFAPTLSTPFPVRDFHAAVRAGTDSKTPGMIIDLRGTQGGDSSLVPKMLASFVTEPTFYETPAVFDDELETFLVESKDTVMVEPHSPVYEGPVLILVDGYTMGPSESFAYFLKSRENVTIFGISGTYGSPGTPGIELTLPGGYAIAYPTRRSTGEDGTIQGVTDAAGAGNIAPERLFEMDFDNARALYLNREDRILEEAIKMLGGAPTP